MTDHLISPACAPPLFAAAASALAALLDEPGADAAAPAAALVELDSVPDLVRAALAAHGARATTLELPLDAPGGVLTPAATARLAAAAAAARGGRWWVVVTGAEALTRPDVVISANALMRLLEARAAIAAPDGARVGMAGARVVVTHRGRVPGAAADGALARLRARWAVALAHRPPGRAQRPMNLDALFARIGGAVDATGAGAARDWSRDWAAARASAGCVREAAWAGGAAWLAAAGAGAGAGAGASVGAGALAALVALVVAALVAARCRRGGAHGAASGGARRRAPPPDAAPLPPPAAAPAAAAPAAARPRAPSASPPGAGAGARPATPRAPTPARRGAAKRK